MITYYAKMAMKAFLRFKLHTVINIISMTFGFLCFIAAFVISIYFNSFDKQFPHSERIFTMKRNIDNENGPDIQGLPLTSRPLASYLRNEFPELDYVVRSTFPMPHDVSVDGETNSHNIRFVEPDFLHLFPIPILKGISTNTPLQPNTVLITYDAALKRFGTTDVIGKRLLIDHKAEVTISGVTEKFDQPSHIKSIIPQLSSDIIAPIEVFDQISPFFVAEGQEDREDEAEDWYSFIYHTYIRFSPSANMDIDDFENRLALMVERVIPVPAGETSTSSLSIQPISRYMPAFAALFTGGADITKMLIFAGAMVLLIACLNTSNLIIAQLIQRSQEIGIQKIMGARRRQLLFQYSFESMLLSIFALVLSLVLSCGVLITLKKAGLSGIQFSLLFSPDLWNALGFVVASLVLISGTYPAVKVSRASVIGMLHSQGSVNYSHRLRSLMVGTQFVISSTLLILLFIIINQNKYMLLEANNQLEDPKIVISNFTEATDIDPEVISTELTKDPGIKSVTRIQNLPWSFAATGILLSKEQDGTSPVITLNNNFVSYDFTSTFEIPFIAGRTFLRERANDQFPEFNNLVNTTGPFSIVIDRAAAKKLGFNSPEDAVGQIIFQRLVPPVVPSNLTVPMIIIGVVENKPLKLISFPFNESAYVLQPSLANHLVVRMEKQKVTSAMEQINNLLKTLLPDASLKPQFMDDLFHQSYQMFIGIMTMITILTFLAFSISCIGLLGIATFIISRRQREVGIRKVMGATSWKVLSMLLLDFSRPVIIANFIAWPLGFVMAKAYISIFSYQASITPIPFLVSFTIAISIACSVVGNQAYKSSRVRPATVLKYE